METLSRPDWLNENAINSVMQVIDDGENYSRFVGGCVRNSILNLPVSDIDIATRHRPETVIKLLSKSGIDVRPTGLKYGTVSAFLDGEVFEITSLRRDLKTDGRHAEISFTDSWEEDAARRDFTMNSIFMDMNGKIFDPLGGYQDAVDGRVRFVGNASERIQEDFLRILRFFRFQSYYGRTEIDVEGLQACKKFAKELARLSGERVRNELFKIILSSDAPLIMDTMEKNHILMEILPGKIRCSEFKQLIDIEGVKASRIRRLAVLLNMSTVTVVNRLKLSNKMAKRLIFLSETVLKNQHAPEEIKKLIYKIGPNTLLDLLTVKTALNPEYHKMREITYSLVDKWVVPKFPIRGSDILNLGIEAGVVVGNILTATEAWWICGEFQADKLECLNWVQNNYCR